MPTQQQRALQRLRAVARDHELQMVDLGQWGQIGTVHLRRDELVLCKLVYDFTDMPGHLWIEPRPVVPVLLAAAGPARRAQLLAAQRVIEQLTAHLHELAAELCLQVGPVGPVLERLAGRDVPRSDCADVLLDPYPGGCATQGMARSAATRS